MKFCILALNNEAPEISNIVKNPSISIELMFKVVTQLLPINVNEFLDEINQILNDNMENQGSVIPENKKQL